MPNKYPEELDQLDSFYQDQLGNVEVLPPADMWDRISASREEDRNKKGFGFPFSNNQKNIGIVILLVLVGVSSSVYFLNKGNEPDNKSTIPVINTPSTDNSTAPENEATDQTINKTTKDNSRSKKSNDSKSVDYKATENNSSVEEKTEEYPIQTTEQPKTEVVDIVPVEKQEEPVEKAPKKKVSFKDKHKQGYQDSTRNLFVPGK